MEIKISNAEWEVMNVVWEKNPIAAADITKRLPNPKKWKQKTVNTFLARLAEKGLLAIEKQGKANFYSPCVPRDECVRSESETFLNRVFQGAVGPLVLHFCEQGKFSEEEIKALRQMLKNKERKK